MAKKKIEIPPVHKKILDLYKGFTIVNGYQPSYVQVGQVLNISGSAVGNHIRQMERAGLVRRPPEKWGRGLTLLVRVSPRPANLGGKGGRPLLTHVFSPCTLPPCRDIKSSYGGWTTEETADGYAESPERSHS